MKKPAGWAGFFYLYFYFTGLGEIVGQEKAECREWGCRVVARIQILFLSPFASLRMGRTPFVAGSREINGWATRQDCLALGECFGDL